jgi:hypothetical protein
MSSKKPTPRPREAVKLVTPAPMRARQVTLTNAEELEVARLRSMSLSECPTPTSSANLLLLADAYSGPIPSPAVATAARTGPGSPGGVDPPREEQPGTDPVADMRDRFSLGDYSGALGAAETILEGDPSHADARSCADNCRSVLQQMYVARIGPLDRVPVVIVPRDQLRWLSIDHRAGFMLSHIDGVSNVEMILDVSGMPLLEALRILFELVQQRVISFR